MYKNFDKNAKIHEGYQVKRNFTIYGPQVQKWGEQLLKMVKIQRGVKVNFNTNPIVWNF